MPATSSQKQGSKRRAGSPPAYATPLRKSSRVKTVAIIQGGSSKKRNGKSDSRAAEGGKHDASASDADFPSDASQVAEENDADDDDDEPQSYSIPLPKARDAGDTPYQDNCIHANTFLFLKDLNSNNNREWLKWHDKDFRTSLKDFETFVEQLSPLIISRDPTIPELPTKDIIFRVYRDIRFSRDPTPYKPYFSAAWSRTGKKGPYAAYYMQLQPGGSSFIGGGLFHPDAPALVTIREDIDVQPHRMKGALMTDVLRQTFFEKVKKDEKKVVAAFVAANSEGALKTKPKGFDADHKDISLLRLRNFTLGKKISDTEVLSTNGINVIAGIIDALVPWVTYLNRVVMPDPAGAADADDENELD